jgi:hypothetical protein
MEANTSPAAFLWGAGIMAVVYTLLIWRVPKFRDKILKFKVFGKAMTKIAPLVIVLLACTPAEAEDGKPRFTPEASAVGPNVALVITWHPGTTDSIRFVALSGVDTAAVAQLARPFTEPQVDTMVLGARPSPGETKTWAIGAAYWWDDRGTSTPGIGSLGNVSYTEPLPAGTPPGFDPLPPPDTTASGPQPPAPTLIAMEVWTDQAPLSDTVEVGYHLAGGVAATDSTPEIPGGRYNFCAMGILSNGFWEAQDGVGGAAALPNCVAEANRRNSLGAVDGATLWMIRERLRREAKLFLTPAELSVIASR